MALTTTTLSADVAVSDTSVTVASATGFAAGNLLLIDQEVMKVAKSYVSGTSIPVHRGQDGSVTTTHESGGNAVTFLASDQAGPPPTMSVQFPAAPRRRIVNVPASGTAATVTGVPGQDTVVVINATAAIGVTLTAPTRDMDGTLMIVVGNGAAAHTITVSGGVGAGGTGIDVGTFATGAQISQAFIACDGVWTLLQCPTAGTVTAMSVTYA